MDNIKQLAGIPISIEEVEIQEVAIKPKFKQVDKLNHFSMPEDA